MEMTRGDNFDIRFQRRNDRKEIITTPADEVYFTVKKNYYDKNFVFQKKLNNGTITFNEEDYFYYMSVVPEDTNNLSYGDYVYDIEIIVESKVKTISKGSFKITEEVTFYTNE